MIMYKKTKIFLNNINKISFLTLSIVGALSFLIVSCRNQMSLIDGNEEGNEDEKPVIEYPATNLAGTIWRLSSFIQTNGSKILKPTDCEDCYTIWFDTDFTFTAIGLSKRLKFDLRDETLHLQLTAIFHCDWYDKDGEDYCDYSDFYTSLVKIGSFDTTNDELNLYSHYIDYYGNEVIGSCLKFKRIYRDPHTILRGTKWKLSGIVDTQSGELRELEPTEFDNYTLTFAGDSIFFYRSLCESKNLMNLQESVYAGERCNDYQRPDWDKESIPNDDSSLFLYGITFAQSFELTHNELKLFFNYQDKNYHLLFTLFYN